MGVYGLQRYIQKDVPNSEIKVDILQQITEWNKNANNEQPLIVFDGLGFLYSLFTDKISTICGHRHNAFINMCGNFLSKLTKSGAKLSFFFDGPVQMNKLSTYTRRNDETYDRMLEVYDAILNGFSSQDILFEFKEIPSNTTLLKAFMKCCQTHGYVHTSVSNECDKELAQYANRNKAKAIFAQDTDFIIFEGEWKYWSVAQLNVNTFETIEYSRISIRTHMGLTQKEMYMFATLAGNDFVLKETLQHFHYKTRCASYKFDNLVQYIKCRVRGADPHTLTDRQLQNIAFDCFPGRERDANSVQLLRTSIDSYDLDFEYPDTEEAPLNTVAFGFRFLLSILDEKISFTFTSNYFDGRNPDFLQFCDIIMPIIRRIVGVVLQHKNNLEITRVLLARSSHEEKCGNVLIEPEYPAINVPALDELHDVARDDLDAIKFRLLAFIITGNSDDLPQIDQIQTGYVTITLALYYLIKLKQIKINEADAILLTVYRENNGLIPKTVENPEFLDVRLIMIANLYTKIHDLVFLCMEAIGFSKNVDYLVFDGVYFHNLVTQLKCGTKEDFLKEIECINELRHWYV